MTAMLTAIEVKGSLLTIRPRELIVTKWMQSSLKNIHPDLGGAAHLKRALTGDNQRIAWIAEEVIRYGTAVGSIAECIVYFLNVSRAALRINNFNTAFQIASALSKIFAIILLNLSKNLFALTVSMYGYWAYFSRFAGNKALDISMEQCQSIQSVAV